MTSLSPTRCHARPAAIRDSEEGYILLAAIFFLALLVLSLAVAAPKLPSQSSATANWKPYHRGMQYRRAIQLYYRKFHAYPPNVDALVKTNNIRFLRKKYIDPITGQRRLEAGPLRPEQSADGDGLLRPAAGRERDLAGGRRAQRRQWPAGSRLGAARISPSAAVPLRRRLHRRALYFGSSSTGATNQSWRRHFGQAHRDRPGAQHRGTGSTGSTDSSTAPAAALDSGQTFGGAGIIGFSPGSPKQSILVYKKKNHYNEWEFTYDPLSEMKTMRRRQHGDHRPAGRRHANTP